MKTIMITVNGTSPAYALIALVLLIAVVGCGQNSQLPVHGMVTLDGAPLTQGVISFQPAAAATGRSSGSLISNGSYAIAAAHGLLPGKYFVTISASKATGRTSLDPMSGGQAAEVAPVAFAEKQPLEATIVVGKDNVLDFHLTSAKRRE
jgi:hypothetical protein